MVGGAGLPGSSRLTGNRRFLFLSLARLVSVLGDGFGRVALAFAVLGERGATPWTLSAVLAAQAAPQLALTLFGGVLADRLGRARMMIAADLAAGLAWGGLAVGAFRAAPAVLLAAVALLAGTAKALFMPALTGLTPQLVPSAQLQRANAVMRVGQNLALLLGLTLSGMAVATLGAPWAVTLNAVSFLVSAGLIAAAAGPGGAAARAGAGAVRFGGPGTAGPDAAGTELEEAGGPGAASVGPAVTGAGLEAAAAGPGMAGAKAGGAPRGHATRLGPHALADLREGAGEFFSRQWLWVVAGQYAFVVGAVNACVGVLGPLVAARDLGGVRAWSVIAGAQALGTLAGAGLATRVRVRRPIRAAVLATFPAALPMLVLAVRAPVPACAAAMFAAGVASDIFGVLWTTTLQREVPLAVLSRVSAFDLVASLALAPAGLAAAGPAASELTPSGALLGCAGLVLASTGAALLSPDVRRLRSGGMRERSVEMAGLGA